MAARVQFVEDLLKDLDGLQTKDLNKIPKKVNTEFFFNKFHSKFFSNYDISFMEFFLEIMDKDDKFCIEHTKLVEYGVLSSNESGVVKRKLERHDMKEGENFKVDNIVDLSSSTKQTKNIYYLTPDCFKKCLMGTRKYPGQTVNPEVYRDYFLLLEKVHKYYKMYEGMYDRKILDMHKEVITIKDDKIDELSDMIREQTLKIDEQTLRINKLINYSEKADTERADMKLKLTDVNKKVDILTMKINKMSIQMNTFMNLFTTNGTGCLIFKNILETHEGSYETRNEELLYPGISRMKVVFLVPFFLDGTIKIYCIARNLGKSFNERIAQLNKRHIGWRKIIPQCISLIYNDVNQENTFLENNSFWNNARYSSRYKKYEVKYDTEMTRTEVKDMIMNGIDAIKDTKLNEYQKNIYGYDIQGELDHEVIDELIQLDSTFHTNTRNMIQNYIDPFIRGTTEEPIIREDVLINNTPVSITESEYNLVKLHRFIKTQNAPSIVQRFIEING